MRKFFGLGEDQASKKNEIPLQKALIRIAITLVVVLGIGFGLGYLFFWNKPQYKSKVDYDYQTALTNVKKSPNSSELRVELGWVYTQQGQWDKALEEYENAIKLNKDNLTAKYNIALVKLQQNKLEEVRTLLEEVVEARKTFTEARLTLGEVLLELKEYDKAMEHFQFALNANPGTVDYIMLIGQTYEKKGELDKAKEQYEKAVAYVPDYQPAKDALAKLGGK